MANLLARGAAAAERRPAVRQCDCCDAAATRRHTYLEFDAYGVAHVRTDYACDADSCDFPTSDLPTDFCREMPAVTPEMLAEFAARFND